MIALKFVALVVASFASGAVNAVAGGGTLIVFPAMLALGYGALPANLSTTIGLVPGYLGGSVAYRAELREQRALVRALAATSIAGGLAGSLVLLLTPSHTFRVIVPPLVLAATLLLAVQPLLRRVVARRLTAGGRRHTWFVHTTTFIAGIYGAYFGGALGIVLLAVLGVSLAGGMQRINALKGVLSLLINAVAALVFAIWGNVPWGATVAMAVGALAGGHWGVGIARRVGDERLRWTIVALGTAVALVLWIRT
jgi:uncharacterized membrane protein YfcA